MMARRFWIVGLTLAVIVYSGFVIVCLVAFINHRHMDLRGCTVLVLSAYAGYFALGRLRATFRSGDPTREFPTNIPE